MKKILNCGTAVFVVSLLVIVGVLTFAGPCGTHDDGSVSVCFWAMRGILAFGITAGALSLIRLFVPNEGTKAGLALACVIAGIMIALIPGILINICSMATMHCVAVMRPFAVVCGIILAILAAIDTYILLHPKKHRGE